MGRRSRRTGNGVDDWLVETAPDVPRADLPKPFLGGRVRLRWVRGAVGASLVLVPLLAIALIVSLASGPQPDRSAQARTSATEPAAAAAVVTWLRRSPSPVPGGGQILTWDGETPTPAATPEPGQEPGPDLSTHTFTVLGGTGQMFSVSVVTATSPSVGTVTVGDPSLIPLPAAEDSADIDAWPGLDSADPSDAVEVAVSSWARAYTSGDPATLLQATQDPDTSHSYMPLMGGVFTEVSVTDAGAVWGDAEPTDDTSPPAMVVRLDTRLYWLAKGQTSAPAGLTPDRTSPVSFDLLVQRTDTASPVVVAWGAAGSGEQLRPFQNAIVGRRLVTESAAPPAPSPTPSRPTEKAGR